MEQLQVLRPGAWWRMAQSLERLCVAATLFEAGTF